MAMVHIVESTREDDVGTTDALGRPATFEEWWAIPAEYHAEYVGGRIYMNPAAGYTHQRALRALCRAVEDQLPSAVLALTTGWRMFPDRQDYRIPDLMILTTSPDGEIVTRPPLVAVEVLSHNRSTDLVRKSHEYLEAGATQYWLVDPRDRAIDLLLATESGWQPLAELDDENPRGTVAIDGVGQVELDLVAILG